MLDASLESRITELWLAAYLGDVPKLKELVADPEIKKNIDFKNPRDGHSALFFACYDAGRKEAVQVLLDAGADPLQSDHIGRRPLHLAAYALDPHTVALLLERGKDSPSNNMKGHVVTATGQTPLHVIFLPGSGVGQTATAASANRTLCIQLIVDKERDPRTAIRLGDKNGISPIMLVKRFGHLGDFEPILTTMEYKMMQILHKQTVVPGNIDELLKAQAADATDVIHVITKHKAQASKSMLPAFEKFARQTTAEALPRQISPNAYYRRLRSP